MGRPRKGQLQRDNLVKQAAASKKVDPDKAAMVTPPTSREKPLPPEKSAKVPSPTLTSCEDNDLTNSLQKLSLDPDMITAVPPHILDIVTYQEMLLRIPKHAHPGVTQFTVSKFQEFTKITTIQTEELHKYLPLVTKEKIEGHLYQLSEKAGISFTSILVPPVSHCLHCDRLLDPMIKKSIQVILFDHGGVQFATKFRHR